MFSLKIDNGLLPKYVEGISLKEGDKLKMTYLGGDGVSIVEEEICTIKSINHYNGDLFIVTFEEKEGSYVHSLNQLIHFKVDFGKA